MLLAIPLLVACTRDGDGSIADEASDVTDSDTGAPLDTEPPPPPELTAECWRQLDNALRGECFVTVEPPQPVDVVFAPTDASRRERVHSSGLVARDHTVGLYIMKADTEYTWTVRTRTDPQVAVTGTLVTGSLPEGADATLDVTGVSSAAMFGTASPCTQEAHVVLQSSSTGDVLWYQDLARDGVGYVEAASFTEDLTVLVLSDGHVVEVDIMGRLLLDVTNEALPERVHHDVFKRDGLVYVLFQEELDYLGGTYLLDGFYVFDEGGTLRHEWHLFDHYLPSGAAPGPFPDDHSHANAIWVDPSGDILVSFRHLSGFLRLDGVDSPSFGEIQWRLSGVASSPLGSDFALSSQIPGAWLTFEMQHNVHVLADGRYALLDNRQSVLERSRVLVLDLDPVAGTAVIDEVYDMPIHCDFQGSAWFTDAGNPTATCAPYRRMVEWTRGTDLMPYEIEANCAQGIPQYTPRIVPVDW